VGFQRYVHPSIPLFLPTLYPSHSRIPSTQLITNNSKKEGPSYLLNFPIQPLPLQSHAAEESDPQSLAISYIDCDSTSSVPTPTVKPILLDLSSLSSPHAGIIKHIFPASGPKSRPVHLDVNGRKDRNAVCVLYGDAMRYEVLDLESELVLEEEEEEGEGEGSSIAMEDEDGIDG
jgi:anaphase-promoting complex subunit 4